MTTDQAKQLRDDFATWSGGFEPESEDQIDQYIEGSLGVNLDPDEARMNLLLPESEFVVIGVGLLLHPEEQVHAGGRDWSDE